MQYLCIKVQQVQFKIVSRKNNKLSDGGKILFPLDDNFGMLKDKYGVQWIVVHKG